MKDAKNPIVYTDLTKHEWSKFLNELSEGKTLLLSLDNGEKVQAASLKGYNDALDAHFEIIKQGENLGTCGCGKPANVQALVWRD